MTDSAPSKHTTRQEIVKNARVRCRLCGMTAAFPIVIEAQNTVGRCANVAVCAKRQRGNEKEKQGTQNSGNSVPDVAPPKKANASK